MQATGALARIPGNMAHTAGENSRCRIYRGNPMQSGDFRTQSVSIGGLSFQAVDYGDTIPSSGDLAGGGPNNEDQEGGNQSALISMAVGVAGSAIGQERSPPSGPPSSQVVSELREIERPPYSGKC